MRRSGFLTFVSALIPGVGYMYLGLIKRGVQALAIFLLIEPLLGLIGMRGISSIISIPFWCYTFFDTLNLSRRMDKGEIILDSDFLVKFSKQEGELQFQGPKMIKLIAWGLIIIGALAFFNNIVGDSQLYRLIISYTRTYFVPVLFIAGGVFLLFKNN